MASVDAFGGQAGLVEREEKGLSLEKRERSEKRGERRGGGKRRQHDRETRLAINVRDAMEITF